MVTILRKRWMVFADDYKMSVARAFSNSLLFIFFVSLWRRWIFVLKLIGCPRRRMFTFTSPHLTISDIFEFKLCLTLNPWRDDVTYAPCSYLLIVLFWVAFLFFSFFFNWILVFGFPSYSLCITLMVCLKFDNMSSTCFVWSGKWPLCLWAHNPWTSRRFMFILQAIKGVYS